jgi:DNA topoisomerase IB
VNAYLGEVMGAPFTAKDFRTWGATFAAFRQLARMPWSDDANGGTPGARALAAGDNAVNRVVADLLGNTPAVCRSSYIDPAVLAGWRDGSLQRAAEGAIGERQWEQVTLRFLKSARSGKPRGRTVAGRQVAQRVGGSRRSNLPSASSVST